MAHFLPFSPSNEFVFTGLVARMCHFDVISCARAHRLDKCIMDTSSIDTRIIDICIIDNCNMDTCITYSKKGQIKNSISNDNDKYLKSAVSNLTFANWCAHYLQIGILLDRNNFYQFQPLFNRRKLSINFALGTLSRCRIFSSFSSSIYVTHLLLHLSLNQLCLHFWTI